MRGISKRLRLIHIVLATLLIVGLIPLAIAGWSLSTRSEDELRSLEGRYQAQLVQDKARHIQLYARRYRDVVVGLARAFELAGGVTVLNVADSDARLRKTLQDDPNLIALSILPVNGDPRSAFQPDLINRDELNERVGEVLALMSTRETIISRPRVIRSGMEMGFTVAAPVMGGADGNSVVAAVVAIISFQEIFVSLHQSNVQSEKELLDKGLPVIFVVDKDGRAIAHPDPRVAFEEQSMTNLKVVQEWITTGTHVQSALAPFTVERDGKMLDMLGSYATAELDKGSRLGIIAIQNERAALASVDSMRHQTILISLVAAIVAMLIGTVFAKQLTNPVKDLATAAQRIASGDFSQRITITNHTELGDLGDSFNQMTDKVEQFINDLQRAADANRELFLGTVKALAAAIDGKDPYTRGHSERVARFSMAIAQRLDLSDEEVEKIRISALLHDVGKIGIDDKILKKPAPLTDEEYQVMKEHPQKGYRIMSQIPAMKDFLPGMYMHHEMINGQGYPQGLHGDEIPMQARIISVADTFDAMTTDRPYQKAMKIEEALELIKKYVGTRYDENVVRALSDACESGQIKAGSVKLARRPKDSNAKPVNSDNAVPSDSSANVYFASNPFINPQTNSNDTRE
jgi:HD-GYP domain-containing protein (c-di-GMP phosphodiesterase class II)